MRNISGRDLILYGLLFLTILLFLPNNIGSGFYDVTLVITFFYYCLVRNVKWKKLFTDPVLVVWLVFCAWLLVSGFINTPLETFLYKLRKWPMRGFFLLVMLVDMAHSERERDRKVLFFLCITSFVWGLLGGYFSYFYEQRWISNDKFEAFEVHWNATARYLNLYIFFMLACGLMSRRTKHFCLYFGVSTLGIVGVILSQSRAGTGSLLVGLVLFLFTADLVDIDRKRLLVIVLVLILSIGVLYHLSFFEEFQNRLFRKGVSPQGRMNNIWPHTLELVKDHLWIGNPLHRFDESMRKVNGATVGDAHNEIIQVLYNGGLIGLGLFVFFVYLFFRSGLRQSILHNPPNLYLFGFVCSFFIIWLVHGLVAHPGYDRVFLLLSWFSLARQLPDIPLRHLQSNS